MDSILSLILKAVVVVIFSAPFICIGLLLVVTIREMFTWRVSR